MLLLYLSLSNESKAKAAQDLCHCMSELLDKLRSEMARRVTSCQRAFMVSKSYVPLRIRMASMCWIVKASVHLQDKIMLKKESLNLEPNSQPFYFGV